MVYCIRKQPSSMAIINCTVLLLKALTIGEFFHKFPISEKRTCYEYITNADEAKTLCKFKNSQPQVKICRIL